MLGSVEGFRWLGGNSGLDWSWNGGGVLLEVWVRLGDELGEIWKVLEVWFAVGRRGGEALIFGRGRGGELEVALVLSGCSLSGWPKVLPKVWKEEEG